MMEAPEILRVALAQTNQSGVKSPVRIRLKNGSTINAVILGLTGDLTLAPVQQLLKVVDVATDQQTQIAIKDVTSIEV